MAIIYSKITGEPVEVSEEVSNSLLIGEWEKGAEFYALDPIPKKPK